MAFAFKIMSECNFQSICLSSLWCKNILKTIWNEKSLHNRAYTYAAYFEFEKQSISEFAIEFIQFKNIREWKIKLIRVWKPTEIEIQNRLGLYVCPFSNLLLFNYLSYTSYCLKDTNLYCLPKPTYSFWRKISHT